MTLAVFNSDMAIAKACVSLSRDAFSASGANIFLERAMLAVRRALGAANAMRCSKRKSLCMRVLNWLRAAIRNAGK